MDSKFNKGKGKPVKDDTFSDVLGWALSPEPARLSPFRPDQSSAQARASSGLPAVILSKFN